MVFGIGWKIDDPVQSLVMEPMDFRRGPRPVVLAAFCWGLRNRVENRRSSTEFSNGAHRFPQGVATPSVSCFSWCFRNLVEN